MRVGSDIQSICRFVIKWIHRESTEDDLIASMTFRLCTDHARNRVWDVVRWNEVCESVQVAAGNYRYLDPALDPAAAVRTCIYPRFMPHCYPCSKLLKHCRSTAVL